MSDKIYLGSRLSDLDIGEPSLPVSKVILNVDSENRYIAGDDTGFTVEQDCPWATQTMADSILVKMKGFVYKPFVGADALLDPAAELGDALTVGGTYGVLSQMGRNLDRQGAASVGAPGMDEIEDEYPYRTGLRKRTDRELKKAYSLIAKNSERITLEVGKITSELENYATIEMTDASIELAVSQSKIYTDGKYTELKVTLDGVTVTDSGGTTKIKGSSIETDTLYVKAANIEGELIAAKLQGDKVNVVSSSGTIYGEMSVAQNGALYILSGVASGFLLGGTNANPVVTCLGSFYAENVIADNIQTYLDAFETRISRLEGLFG